MKNPKENHWQALLRPQINGFEPYLPGKSIESVKREYRLKNIVKLASNENPLGPSPKVVKAMAAAAKQSFRYPDGPSTALREALSKHTGAELDRIIVGAGSDELIELLGKTFLNPKDSIIVSEHAFIRYRMAAELMGADVITMRMRNFTHDLSAMSRAIRPDTKMIFIANPNNPTGTYNTAHELEGFLREINYANETRKIPIVVVIDEAYYEYAKALQADYPDTLELQKRYRNVLTLRTFSKAHGLAGLRIGYGVGDPGIISAMDRVRPPFNVNTAAQVAAEASLGDPAHIAKSVKLVTDGRKEILPGLTRLGLPVIPSVGNFILIEVAPHKGADLFAKLLKRGIIVRSMDEYGFPNHIRVTYGLPAENKAFLKAMTEVLDS